MKLRFYIDPATDLPHIYGHNVVEQEVEDVLLHPAEDGPGRNRTRVSVGRTRAGRLVRVIYVPDPIPNSLFVITAYEIRGKPLQAFRRRQRRRPRR
jgi:hypothetical protein